MAHMDRISNLPDELLLTVLSLLPVKDIVVTMVLSKRWKFIWKFVPRLAYEEDVEDMRFSQFVHTSLLLHEAPILESLHFKVLGASEDSQALIRGADKRCVRDLLFKSKFFPVTLDWRFLYTCFKMLVTMKLSNTCLVGDFSSSSPDSFPSLKEMSLKSNLYPSDEFVKKLLSSSTCPVLEVLVVKQCSNDNVSIVSIRLPSLKRLFLHKPVRKIRNNAHGFVIDAPSLECLEINDYSHGFRIIENNMCKIEKANLDISYPHTRQLFGSLTSAKRFYLCLPKLKDAFPDGSVFSSLVHLTMCTCETKWLYILIRLLRDSPKLQSLELIQHHPFRNGEPRPWWSEPYVPKCLSSSLETFEWEDYEGTKEEKEVVGFILGNGSCLKKAIIFIKSTDDDKKLKITKELLSLSRLSPTCHLTVK